MGMPNDLILVRHGFSAGNRAVEAAKHGDNSHFTEEFVTTPGHQWRLIDLGRRQAAASGAFIRDRISPTFDRYFCSTYVRTRETAGGLALPDAKWRLNRALRERDWGDIGTLPRDEFESRPEFALNAWMKEHDPLYWVPPGGESIAHVAENRIRNVLSTMHRECDSQSVICVTHGEAMWAFRLVLERLDDDTFVRLDDDPAHKIHNCEVIHYTRLDPVTGRQAPRLTWRRTAYPVETDTGFEMVVSDWEEIVFSTYSNEDLLASVANVRE